MIDIKPKNVLEQPIYMLTKATSCPYLTGKVEKRIATDISNNKNIYEELSTNGFRRVENWMYKPICDNCSACKSYRVDIHKFKITKSLALELHKTFLEVIIGNGFDNAAIKILKTKKNLRLIDSTNYIQEEFLKFISFNRNILIQSEDLNFFSNKNLLSESWLHL